MQEKGSFLSAGQLLLFLIAGCVVASVASCVVATMPKTFVEASEPGWTRIDLREGVDLEQAWREVIDILAKRFELEVISKDGKYIRTSWLYTWWKQGEVTDKYRVRAVVKFSPDGTAIDVRTEAQFLVKKQWIIGYDTRMLSTIKTDIGGILGRTAG